MRKRSTMVIAAVLMAAALLFTGCDLLFQLMTNIVGDWTLTFNWNSTGDVDATITFNSDKTLLVQGMSGTWSTSGKNITFNVVGTDRTATYTGTYTQTTMSGTMTNTMSQSGVWSAVKDGARSLSAGDGAVDVLGPR